MAQRAMVAIAHRDVVASLKRDPQIAEHLRLNTRKSANNWLRSTSASTQSDAFANALLNRIRYLPESNATHIECTGCRKTFPRDSIIGHTVGCAKHRGAGPNTRHTNIVSALCRAASTNQFCVHRELALDAEGHLRMDIAIDTTPKQIWVDVTVISEMCKSAPTERSAQELKNRKYQEEAQRQSADLITFVCGANGSLLKSANDFIDFLCKNGPHTAEDLKREISTIITLEGGKMASKLRRTMLPSFPRPTSHAPLPAKINTTNVQVKPSRRWTPTDPVFSLLAKDVQGSPMVNSIKHSLLNSLPHSDRQNLPEGFHDDQAPAGPDKFRLTFDPPPDHSAADLALAAMSSLSSGL